MSRDGSIRLVSSVSDPRLSRAVASSSAESTPLLAVRSVSNRRIISSRPPLPILIPSAVVSGTAEGVGIPPSHSVGQLGRNLGSLTGFSTLL